MTLTPKNIYLMIVLLGSILLIRIIDQPGSDRCRIAFRAGQCLCAMRGALHRIATTKRQNK